MRASVDLMGAASRRWYLVGSLLVALVLVPGLAATTGTVDIGFVDALLPTVELTNHADACLVSTAAYAVRLELDVELHTLVEGGRTATHDEVVRLRLDRPTCPGGPQRIVVPLPPGTGIVRRARLLLTDMDAHRPGSETVHAILADVQLDRPFEHSWPVVVASAVGPRRIGLVGVSLLLVLLLYNAQTSRRSLALLWLIVLLLAAWARLPILTLPLYPGSDAFYHHHEAAVVRDTGDYAPVDLRMDPAYMRGLQYLMAALMLLTGTEAGIYLMTLLPAASFAVLVRALRLPPTTAAAATFLLVLHPFHVSMTAQPMASLVSLSLAMVTVALAVALPSSTARSGVLALMVLTISLSHSAGIVYLVLVLVPTWLYLIFTSPSRARALGPCLALVALFMLSWYHLGDRIFYRYALLAGASMTGAYAAITYTGLPTRGTLRPLALLIGALVVLVLSGAGGYAGMAGLTPFHLVALATVALLFHRWGGAYEDGLVVLAVLLMGADARYMNQATLGGTPLLLLVVAAFVLIVLRDEHLELPVLLAIPALLWWLPSLGLSPVRFHQLRLFLVALPGIALFAGRGLTAIVERAERAPALGCALLLLAVVVLAAGHLDRLAFIGVHQRTLLGAEHALPHQPPGDVRDVARFLDERPETSVLIYHFPTTLVDIIEKELVIHYRFPPIFDRAKIAGLCSRPEPPLVVVDRIFRLQDGSGYGRLVDDLSATCYREVHANPTYRVFAARS